MIRSMTLPATPVLATGKNLFEMIHSTIIFLSGILWTKLCLFCLTSDRYGNKQGMPQTFLQDAVKSGCKILENAFVERILYKRLTHGIEGIHRAGAQKATGVLVRHNGQLYTIHASRCVICAAGALHTPCLLTRSGFKNPHIGRNLHLHPVTAVSGSHKFTIPQCFYLLIGC